MKSLKIPMTFEEFDLMEWKFGWKHEYWDGFARLSPRFNGVLVKMPVEKRELESGMRIRSVSESDYDQLVGAFYDAFVDTVEYCNLAKRDVKESAQRNIRDFFAGERGIPQLDLSKAFVSTQNKNRIVGAALISKYKYGFKNEILFVRPKYQNMRVGTALVSSVLNNLKGKREKIFWSEYHVCNEQSAAWHKKFGFVEEPDITVARMRFHYFYHEVWRREKAGEKEEAKKIKPLLKKAKAELKKLEKIEEENFGAARLSWKYDY